MNKHASGGLVYSTEHGRMCPACRAPLDACVCQAAAVPAGVSAEDLDHISIEMAAATMPRGSMTPMKSRSLRVNPEPNEHRKLMSGR